MIATDILTDLKNPESDDDNCRQISETGSDDELYAAYLAGDKSAFDSLMLKNSDALTMFLRGFLYNWHDAEDMMIEAFARILVNKPKIGEGNFKAYLYRTARHLISRFYGKEKRRKTFSLEEHRTEYDLEPEYDAKLEENILKDERKRLIHKCLENIDPEMREALWLFYFEEMTYEQAAQVMGISHKKVDNLISRGRKYLKEELEKEGITDAY